MHGYDIQGHSFPTITHTSNSISSLLCCDCYLIRLFCLFFAAGFRSALISLAARMSFSAVVFSCLTCVGISVRSMGAPEYNQAQLEPAMQIGGTSSVDASLTTNPHATMSDVPRGPPSPLNHLTFGINEVAKLLEGHVHHQRRDSLRPASSSDAPNTSSSKLVAVCLADVNPPTLVGHLPSLVAACNSVKGCGSTIWLVPLPKGAEEALAAAAGLKRAAAIAIDVSVIHLRL